MKNNRPLFWTSLTLATAAAFGLSHESDADRYRRLFSEHPQIKGFCEENPDGLITFYKYTGVKNHRPVLIEAFSYTTAKGKIHSLVHGRDLGRSYMMLYNMDDNELAGACQIVDLTVDHPIENADKYLSDKGRFEKAFDDKDQFPDIPPQRYLSELDFN